MGIKHILAFLGAAAASTMALAAPVAVSDDGNTVYVAGNASRLVRLTNGEAESVTGAFRLEDGRILTLTHQGSRMFMEVDDKIEELLPTSKTHFVGRHSGAELTIDQPAYPGTVRLLAFSR